ncbi:MAG: CDP-alcohol phosphatidyltransferase family protein [Candidatus Zixiibacteriota bacterium]
MIVPEIFRVSNLFSLFRVAIIPVLWHFLSQPDKNSPYIALAILILAGITDGLDGYFARKLNQISPMGMILDPLCDKILAGALVLMLILYRDFPIWLAALIIGRDLIILTAAALLLRRKKVVVPSNITGKYAFFFIVVLLACSVIRFDYGIWLTTCITTGLIILSIVMYVREFGRFKKGENPAPFLDRPIYRIIRLGLTVAVLLVLLLKLYLSVV